MNNEILSDVVVFDKYAKYLPELKRRETFDEICDRYEEMMIDRYPELEGEIVNNMKYVREKKILPSMRAMQFAGAAIDCNESRMFNCAYLPVDSYLSFSETMFLLLGGTGVGFSVQDRHISQIPTIEKPIINQRFFVEDSIEGWADAVKYLIKSYLGLRKTKPIFNFTKVRPKGARLVTAGGKAPGPEPLKKCLFLIEQLLETKEDGQKLTSVECYDIQCYIADAVLAGGIRRAAMICLFDKDDIDMIACKSVKELELNPQRYRANNSAVLLRSEVTYEEFATLFQQVQYSGTGEPGLYFSNNLDILTNPCAEISLREFSFCNLCELNASTIENEKDYLQRVKAATFLGTLQAGYTDFHYLRKVWQETTEEDALVGIGMTGLASGKLDANAFNKGADLALHTNEVVAELIGINKAARVTTVKPSGSTSCVLGTSSGIHAWHSEYYIRRMQLSNDHPLINFFMEHCPSAIKPYKAQHGDYVLEFPMKAPEGAIVRDKETSNKFLERVLMVNKEWVKRGHRSGDNTNNVSATVNVKPGEWEGLELWLWENRDDYNGISMFPHSDARYEQCPFEEISEETYDHLISQMEDIDLTKLIEEDDETTISETVSCAGGSCEII